MFESRTRRMYLCSETGSIELQAPTWTVGSVGSVADQQISTKDVDDEIREKAR